MSKVQWKEGSFTNLTPMWGESCIPCQVVIYAQNRGIQLYLDITRDEAVRRFEENMEDRTTGEIENEGWEAELHECGFTNNEMFLFLGAAEQMQTIADNIMRGVFGQGDDS